MHGVGSMAQRVTLLAAAALGCGGVAALRMPAALAPTLRGAAPMSCARMQGLQCAEGGGDLPSPVAQTPSNTVEGEVDLSKMTFEERLAYLAAESENTPLAKDQPQDEVSMFGIGENPETQWWRPAFWKLCLEDLQTLVWPSRAQTIQTLVTSQAAFVVILILILVLDATAEAAMRSLLQGAPFR